MINAILNQTILNFKYFIKNKTRTLMLLMIPIILTFIPVIFFPMRMVFPLIFEMSIIFSSGIVFISLSINMRESSLYDNMEITKNDRWSFNLSILITMFFVSFLEIIIITSLIQIYSIMGILLIDWYKYFSPGINNGVIMFNELFYVLIYFAFVMTMVLFSICFFLSRVLKNEKPFYIIIFLLGILSIFFGGSLNNYFQVEYVFGSDDKDSVMAFLPAWSLFPASFFKWFLFFPFFAPGELLQPYVIHSLTSDRNVAYDIMRNTNFHYFAFSDIHWNIMWFDPLLFVITFGLLGVLSRHK